MPNPYQPKTNQGKIGRELFKRRRRASKIVAKAQKRGRPVPIDIRNRSEQSQAYA